LRHPALCGKVAPQRNGDRMRDAEQVTFAGGTIDRAAWLRADTAALHALHQRTDAGVLPVWRGKPLVAFSERTRLEWLPPDHAIFSENPGLDVFLGLEGAAPRFAQDISTWQDPAADDDQLGQFLDQSRNRHPDLAPHLQFAELRSVMAELGPDDAGNAAAAKGIIAWHGSHGHCAKCGAESQVDEAGWRRLCARCGAQHFPRTDPVVIMLITHANLVLLGRSAIWPPGMYSLLAGFMEPGESIEAAVRRETWEEAGIPVGPVRYLSSQPWPFPSSLMIGCHGEALSDGIRRDPNELEDARWLTREQVLAGLTGQDADIRPARQGSIARFLLERWLADRID
jgi:NAD+ diphosphatase